MLASNSFQFVYFFKNTFFCYLEVIHKFKATRDYKNFNFNFQQILFWNRKMYFEFWKIRALLENLNKLGREIKVIQLAYTLNLC